MATGLMTWEQFQAIPNGTKVFNHGWDECVALANLYQESVLGQPFVAVGSAYQWWTLFRNYPALYNTYKQSGVPIAGAVVVSRYGIYDAPNGHIEVVTSVNSDGSFNTMGQNASGHRYVWRYRRTMQNILGFLHPYNNPATQEEDDMYSDADRKRDAEVHKKVAEIHWMLDQRIRPQLDRLEGITNGDGWGIRHLIGETRREIATIQEVVNETAPDPK